MRAILISAIIFIIGCSSWNRKNVLPGDSGNRLSQVSALNYEHTSAKYNSYVLNTHLMVHIDIEKPFVIESVREIDVDPICRIAQLEGITIFRAEINKKGEIDKYRIVKSSGLGIDDYAERILKGMKISPAFHKGRASGSNAEIRIEVRGKNRI